MSEHPRRSLHPRLLKSGLFVTGITSASALFAMLIIAIEKVESGHGMENYRTMWMVEDSWIGFLTFIGVAAISVGVIGVVSYIKGRRDNFD